MAVPSVNAERTATEQTTVQIVNRTIRFYKGKIERIKICYLNK